MSGARPERISLLDRDFVTHPEFLQVRYCRLMRLTVEFNVAYSKVLFA